MSTYIKELTNPKTGKKQRAVCHDDHYGNHIYGYGFKRDGSDFIMDDFGKQDEWDKLDFYRREELLSDKTDKNAK